MMAENHGNAVKHSPCIRIVRGQAWRDDPCAVLQELAVKIYGPSSALPVSLLRSWYAKNRAIFRIAVTSDKFVVGYFSCLPLFANIFGRTIDPEFQEGSITADDIDSALWPPNGGVFISSVVVAPEFQKRSPASLLLRLAFIEDLIRDCPGQDQTLRMSAQALSPKGEACMRSLGMQAWDFTAAGWKVYYGQLGKADLLGVRKDLQHKLATRF